jgi:ubiquinone/menaquinone biosynthesis C-methylase UbiE
VDVTQRFSDRVENYAKARPTYPAAVFDFLRDQFGLSAGQIAADLGSGTGIFARLLLELGLEVYAVEPNASMRGEAERMLAHCHGFHSHGARAEATGLPDTSVDWVTAAQAFHWFNVDAFRDEVRRIVRRGGCCALIWNERQTDTSAFAAAYERFLVDWSVDYEQVKASYENADHIAKVLGPNHVRRAFPHAQEMDRDTFRARQQSASYVPASNTSRGLEMMRALDRLFDAHHSRGTVRFDYLANVYCARIGD